MTFQAKVENKFFDLLKEEELDEDLALQLEHSLRLMELTPEEAEDELKSNPELINILGLETINIIEGSESEVEESLLNDSEEEIFPEDVYGNVNMERGESSGIKPDLEGYERPRAKRKTPTGAFFPTTPKSSFGESKNTGNLFLNIDCTPNRKELIDIWAAEISLIIQTNQEAYESARNVILLAEHKSLGIAKEFIKKTVWDELNGPNRALESILEGLYSMFLGLNYVSDKFSEIEKEQEEARKRLTRLQLCDIIELDNFNCDFEKHFFKLKQAEYPEYIKQYLTKIPIVGDKALKRFAETAISPMTHSLGYAIKIVKEEIASICELSKKQKRLKKFNKSCCKGLGEPPVEYGCQPSYKKKNKLKKYKKYKFIKKRKSFKPGKYFKRKSYPSKTNPKDKSKFCPKGKKNCRCWICNIEGHYANECPNRQNSNKIKLLEFAYQKGYEPIEEEYDETENVYIIEIKEPGKDSSSSEESDYSD